MLDVKTIILKNGKLKEKQGTEKYGFEKGKLLLTDVGALVNKFLLQYFDDVLDYNFTANVEKEFDKYTLDFHFYPSYLLSFCH